MNDKDQYAWLKIVEMAQDCDSEHYKAAINAVEQECKDARRLAALVLEVHKLDTYHASQTPLDKMLELAMALAGWPAPDDPRALLARIEETQRGTIVLENTSTDPVHVHFTPKAEQRREGGAA